MEDDDEFGDLYKDVLQPYSSSLSSAPKPQEPSPAAPSSIHRPIDLNLHNDDDDDEILYGASHGDIRASSNQTLGNKGQISVPTDNNSAGEPRVMGAIEAKLVKRDSNTGDGVGFQSGGQDEEVKFDIEEANTGIMEDSGAMIPGLAINADDSRRDEADVRGERGGGEGDEDWDEESDSEDDWKIVLNDTKHGPMGMERGVMGDGGEDDDDDDEDGDPLIIVGGGAPNQAMDEQDWVIGEDAAAASGAEGEKKEGGEGAGKGTTVAGPKIGYSNQGYHHPFHSQFKYVRPGAAPMPGATAVGPGGVPGQVRPPVSMGHMSGRGRGDWRPPGIKNAAMQKNFHTGFGMPGWGNNAAGRGFGGGLDFTLPSYKTIFEVDIDSFEEKPWKYPGVDMSDFFNFGLNEESWKDYCKQLEQHRLETTMQSKIRVYESGRAEQEFDPDLPPELAAAAGIHDIAAANSNIGKSDVGQSDLTKGSARVRPPFPTGRAIQVESGYGERLPSIDTRPPRIRDSDAIIEIVLQDSIDNDSGTGNGALDEANNEPSSDDFRGSHAAEDDKTPIETEYFDEERDQYRPGSKGQSLMYPGGDYGATQERRTQDRTLDGSPHPTPTRSTPDKKFLDNMKEESVESMDGKYRLGDARELSVEDKDDALHDELVLAEVSSGMKNDEMTDNEVTASNTLKDENTVHLMKKQKIDSRVEQPVLPELDDGEDSKTARSSENSKARSGSSKDYQKWRDSLEEEEVQDGRSTRTISSKRPHDENLQKSQRKDRDVRQEMERNRMVRKGKEDSFPYRDLDPSLAYHLHMKNEGYGRQMERGNPDGAWQRRDEDPYRRKNRSEDTKKRERVDEIRSRHGSKTRESKRDDKDEHHSRKQLDNGSYMVHYEKDGSSRLREREDSMKSRYDFVDDYHSKRRKDEEYLRRDHADKEQILHGRRETASHRRRERDDALDPRKRDEQQRVRDNLDDYHSTRHKDELWLHRERVERHREREESYRLKPSHVENLSKWEREDGRDSARSGRVADDKSWITHARLKDEYRSSDKEYQSKDVARNNEQQKRRTQMEDENLTHHRGRDDGYARGNQFSNEERRARQERSGTRIDRPVDTSDNQKVHEKKHKENTRKNKQSVAGDIITSGASRRNQEDQGGKTDEMRLKHTGEQGNGEIEISVQGNSSKRHKEGSSDDEQGDSRRGRSKLERWMSHKERDYSIRSKLSTSLKFQEIGRKNNGGPSEAGKLLDEPPRRAEAVEKHPSGDEDAGDVENKDTNPKSLDDIPLDRVEKLKKRSERFKLPTPSEKDALVVMKKHPSGEEDAGDVENKDTNPKSLDDVHLDRVEKLKKRSERFKLPMPSEKDTSVVTKKIESEALPSVKTETPTESEIKPERPARKRRWISN